MTLNAWQDRLNAHFQSLHGSAERGTRPIFALEHGLNEEELAELKGCLEEHIRWTQPANGHWLAWIVFAAEVGYKFAGDQYWQTFKEQLNGWEEHEDRYYIRDAFRRFHKVFGGAKPSGPWANNFTIISWPIANAILPKDLQKHLARVLFETRHLFTKELIEDPARLGELIDAHSLWTSSRFRQFAEEHDLVGRIAAALLSPTDEIVETLLSLPTLRRITGDLEREQKSKDQLDDARARASSVVFRGTRPAAPGAIETRPDDGLEEDPEDEFDPNRTEFQTKIFLSQSVTNNWDLKLLLPDFGHLVQARPEFAQAFSRERSFIDGADRPFFPGKFLLCGRRTVTLLRLPNRNRPFLHFEVQSPEMTALLESVCRFPDMTAMLFRVTDDGAAIRIRSRTLRPGCQYVLLRPAVTSSTIGLQGAHEVSISCEGLRATQIDLPDFVSTLFQEEAAKLGLDVASGLSISPVGYPPSRWDEEGCVEWTQGTPMLLKIASDFQLDEVSLVLFGGAVDRTLNIPTPGEHGCIINLEGLDLGSYQLHIAAKLLRGQGLRTGSLDIQVSSPTSHAIPSAHGAFTVLASPPAPTMEELWSNAASLDVYGAAGLRLDCFLRFYADTDKTQLLLEHHIPKITVPLTAEEWTRYLNDSKGQQKVSNAFDAAALCSITFRSVGLGNFELDCEREFVPFRLRAKRSSSAYKLRLVQNDTTEAVSIDRASFAKPGHIEQIVNSSTLEFTADAAGGLYAARRGDVVSAIVIPPIRITALADIQIAASRLPVMTTAEQLSQLASSISLWSEAQSIGDILSTQRRDAALLSLRTCFVESICGAPWVSLEENISHNRGRLDDLATKLGSDQYCSIVRSALFDSAEFVKQSPQQLIGFAVQIFQQKRPSAASINDAQGLALLLPYLQISQTSGERFPSLPEACSAFAFSERWLMQILRFACFAKELLTSSQSARPSTLEHR